MRFQKIWDQRSVLFLKVLRVIFRIISWANRIVGLFGMLVLFAMSILVTADIISRELAHKSIPGVTEIVYLGIVAVVVLSFAYAEEKGAHVRMEIIPERLSARGRMVIDIFSWVTGAFIMGLLAWLAGIEAGESWSVREYIPTAIRVPIYPVKFAVCIGFALLSLQFFIQIVKRLLGAKL